ncbi:MAG TPA: chromosome segregation protein SMC [Candidatus Eisenbacteria bacterium]|nr:chromosome segregation protein SMC [Candidatus Eisenbacteria bacterium]
MFLQRLDIQGFKSFPQRVRVDFGPGITAVVGPNGSGKTNIVEAIRWVLGEQNMRHLRGDTLEDVIFTGSAHRKPLGMAEVSLTMVNNRGVLPSEYTEVAIARRTFRSGQSEYMINRNACRLRDVRDLFLDTGMGSHAYSLIERGMVDNVLSDESGHRRFLFEEAAGIMRYKTRKKEALQKLDLTHADLTRVNDITVEIEREVRSLARQVGKARRYGRLRDEIRGVDLGLSREAYDRLSREAGTLHQERHNAENRRSSLGGTLAHREAELEELKLELLKREGEVRLAQEALSEHEARGAALLNEVAVLRERRLGLVEKLEHARSEADRLEKSVEEVRGHASRLDLDRERLTGEQGTREAEERRLEEELAAMGPQLDQRRSALAERKQLSLDLFEARVMQESSARNWREKLEDLGKRRGEIEAQRDALARDEDVLRAGIRDIERALEETQGEVERGRERVEQATQAIARAEARIREHDEIEIKARESHAGLEARHATLRELKERYEGYDASVRWLVAGPSRPPRVLGTVGDVLHASGDWLSALEAALGEAVQFVVAERTEAAVHALRALEQSGEGRATFISLDRLSRVHAAQISDEVLTAPGVLGPLIDHVRFEPGYVALASFLLSSVVVVDTIDAGLALNERFQGERLQFVTRRGERVVGPGIFQGGGGPTRAGSVLRREEELTDLAAEIERSAASLAAILKTAEENRAERASAVSVQEESTRLLQVAEQAHRAQESRLAEQKIRGDAMVQAASSLASSLAAVVADLTRALGESESAQVALRSADEERGRVDAILAQEETEVRELERDREHRVALHAEARVEATRARSALEAAIRERERLTRSADEAEREIGSRREEAVQTETRIQETETLCAEREAELAQEIQKKAEREVLLQGARERFGEVKGQADDVESTTREVRREHATLTERLHKAELEQAEADGELRRLLERVRNEYEIDLASWAPEAEAAALPGDADAGDPALAEIEEGDVELEPDSSRVPDEAIVDRGEDAFGSAPITDGASREEREARLRYLQEKLRSIGPVNLLAVQDYEERRQRLGFLNGQRKDLEDARQQLLEAIEKINATASELFLKTFEQVNKNFVQVFTTLFQGGEAALVLTGEDPLEAEIEILARPRGKKPQSLSLLSGGEKALTAIALLFAIYLEKPSPFCILDEVDAPLDDANIDRFVALLRDFSAKTQFIVVTHNKKTMEVADALYGVTMQEPGVSKLVSVRWNRERQDVDQVDAPPEELAPAAS